MTYGVPQGSHLGPLLFIMLLMTSCQNSKFLFADYLKCFKIINDIPNCLNL